MTDKKEKTPTKSETAVLFEKQKKKKEAIGPNSLPTVLLLSPSFFLFPSLLTSSFGL